MQGVTCSLSPVAGTHKAVEGTLGAGHISPPAKSKKNRKKTKQQQENQQQATDLPTLDQHCLETIFSSLPSNLLLLAVKSLSKGWRNWVISYCLSTTAQLATGAAAAQAATASIAVAGAGVAAATAGDVAAAGTAAAEFLPAVKVSDGIPLWALCHLVQSRPLTRKQQNQLLEISASRGELGSLQWLHGQRWPLHAGICNATAVAGHIHILQWAWEQGCPWHHHACSSAAGGSSSHPAHGVCSRTN